MSCRRSVGSFCRQRRDQPVNRIGGRSDGSAGPIRLALDDLRADCPDAVASRRTAGAGEHLEQDAAEGPESVRSSTGSPAPAPATCRRRCRGSARSASGRSRSDASAGARPPVDAPWRARSRAPSPCRRRHDLDVGGLEVAMHDAVLVGRLERRGDLIASRSASDADRTARDPVTRA